MEHCGRALAIDAKQFESHLCRQGYSSAVQAFEIAAQSLDPVDPAGPSGSEIQAARLAILTAPEMLALLKQRARFEHQRNEILRSRIFTPEELLQEYILYMVGVRSVWWASNMADALASTVNLPAAAFCGMMVRGVRLNNSMADCCEGLRTQEKALLKTRQAVTAQGCADIGAEEDLLAEHGDGLAEEGELPGAAWDSLERNEPLRTPSDRHAGLEDSEAELDGSADGDEEEIVSRGIGIAEADPGPGSRPGPGSVATTELTSEQWALRVFGPGENFRLERDFLRFQYLGVLEEWETMRAVVEARDPSRVPFFEQMVEMCVAQGNPAGVPEKGPAGPVLLSNTEVGQLLGLSQQDSLLCYGRVKYRLEKWKKLHKQAPLEGLRATGEGS